MTRGEYAGIACLRGREVLLVRRSEMSAIAPGRWSVPAGRVLQGERAVDAARRELLEETSVRVGLLHLAGTSFFGEAEEGALNRQLTFVGRPVEPVSPEPGDGVEQVRWVQLDFDFEVDSFTSQLLERVREHLARG